MARLRVLQISCVADPLRRDPAALLEAWPTLPAVASAARRAGAEVTVFQSAHLDQACERDGVAYRFVAEAGVGRVSSLFAPRLTAAARELAPDVIHLHGLDFPFQARALARIGAPLLVQDHASRPSRSWSALRKWGHAKVAAAAFTARAQAEPFIAAGDLPRATPIFEIPESSSGFAPGDRAAARAATGLFGDPALLWVGHLDENKDPLTILDAVRAAIPHLPDLRLWCCYRGERLLPRVKALLAADPVLAERVHLLGDVPHDRVERLLHAVDFFILGSRRESCGYALLEAMACGVPPIVSDIPAFRALTGSGIVGALAPPGDAPAFARAIVSLANARRDQARAQTLRHFADHLSFARLGARLVDAYGQLRRPG